MMKSALMVTRRPPESESTERNAPSVEAAFQAVPDDKVGELVDGELHVSPHPARPHTHAASRLAILLGGPFWVGTGGPGGWIILDKPEVHLGPRPNKLVPDLAGWRRERLPDAAGGGSSPTHYDLAPDWVCEVLSESTRHLDKGPKTRIYAREGVRHLWHLDPLARTLDVFRLEGPHWLLVDSFAGQMRVRAEPFESFELDLALVWSS